MSRATYKDVHYRRLVRDGWTGGTLSGAIADALNAKPNGSDERYADDWRLRVAAEGENLHRFINNFHIADNFVFGNLCAYTADEMQTVIATSARAVPEVDIEDQQAPTGRDYLHGIAYWLAINDHCYVVQHMSVRSKALEEYLTWFLRETLTTPDSVTLQAVFDIGSVGDDLGDVTSIEIGGLVPETVQDLGVQPKTRGTRLVQRRRSIADRPVFSKCREVLDAAFGTLETERLLERMPEDAALQVMLHVSYLATSREVDRTSMKDLGVALRNLDDGEVRIRAKDGTIRSDEARLKARMPFRRVRENGSLLELDYVLEQLMETHRRFTADGKISPE